MGTVIDIISIIILVFAVVLGYKKGLIKSVIGLVSLIISVVVAINLYSYPAAYLRENVIEPHFVSETSDKLNALMNGGTEVIPPEKVFDDEPEALTETAERFGIDLSTLKEYYENTVKNVTDSFNTSEIAEKLSEFMVESTVNTISNVLGFALAFVVTLIAINLLLLLLNLVFKLPVLKLANKLCGALLGAIKGAIIVIIAINITMGLLSAGGDKSGEVTGTELFFSVDSARSSTTYSLVDSIGLIF